MASASDDPDEPEDERSEGVEFVHEEGGTITARDLETGIASFGESKAEALAMLAEALALHDGEGELVDDEDLREWGLDPEAGGDRELPEFMH